MALPSSDETTFPRRRLLLAALVTAVAVPFLAYQNLAGDDATSPTTNATVGRATAVTAPRPSTGAPKGVSVVTSSTTSSTTPLTTITTTTTTPGPASTTSVPPPAVDG